MSDSPDASDFTDYKFFCFDGKVDCVMVCLERSSGDTKFYFFDEDWKLKRLNVRGKNAPEGFTIPKPSCMDEMFAIAAKLSVGMPFVRVDLYQSNDQIYFGACVMKCLGLRIGDCHAKTAADHGTAVDSFGFCRLTERSDKVKETVSFIQHIKLIITCPLRYLFNFLV